MVTYYSSEASKIPKNVAENGDGHVGKALGFIDKWPDMKVTQAMILFMAFDSYSQKDEDFLKNLSSLYFLMHRTCLVSKSC